VLTSGDTFLIPKSSTEIEHLWIIVTDPDPATFEAVCVNVTTLKIICDKTVTLQPGEHPFIKHPSIILFSDAQKLDIRNIEAALNAESMIVVCKAQTRCSPTLLKRIQDGVLLSKGTPKHIKEYCRQKWQGKKAAKSETA
jgi:hypothetical protein